MVDPSLLSYVVAELTRGVTQTELVRALQTAGWPQLQIDAVFSSLNQPTQSQQSVQVYTETDFPITTLWICKTTLIQIPMTLFFLLLGIVSPKSFFTASIFITFFYPLSILINLLTRKFFHFRTEPQFLFVQQGILSKKQYHLPYGVIQHAIVKQDLFDRIFGLASLLIENAAQGAGIPQITRKAMVYQSTAREPEFIGSSGNKISIPGLKKADAEVLKEVILQKIKDHPTDDNASGL